MFKKFISLAFLLPLASALTLNLPTTALTSGGEVTITWTSNPSTDPGTFDLNLANSAYRNTFAIKASVITALGSLTIALPAVIPGPSYSIEATAVGNVNAVLSTVGPLTLGSPLSNSVSSTLTPISGSTLLPLTSTPASSTIAPNSLTSATATSPAFNGASNVKPVGVVGALALVAAGGALVGF